MANTIGIHLPCEIWTQIGDLLNEDLAAFSAVTKAFHDIVGILVKNHKKMIEQIDQKEISLFKEVIRARYFENKKVRLDYIPKETQDYVFVSVF